jgi:hypothetical protein
MKTYWTYSILTALFGKLMKLNQKAGSKLSILRRGKKVQLSDFPTIYTCDFIWGDRKDRDSVILFACINWPLAFQAYVENENYMGMKDRQLVQWILQLPRLCRARRGSGSERTPAGSTKHAEMSRSLHFDQTIHTTGKDI